MSKDPNTQVGSLIVGPEGGSRADGFNGFPRKIADTWCRLHDREAKNRLMVHAEMNALMIAARVGIATLGCTLYVAAKDAVTGKAFGFSPCTPCALHIIQAGIVEVVSFETSEVSERWRENLAFARERLAEAGVLYREVAV
jgi:dCMP deaminase